MDNNANSYIDTLLYFYSTAPQVLGAILAISGAFVIFKLDSLKKELLGKSQILLNRIKSWGHNSSRSNDAGDNYILTESVHCYTDHQNYQIERDIFRIHDQIIKRLSLIRTEIGIIKQQTIDSLAEERLKRLDILKESCISLDSKVKDINWFIKASKITYFVNGFIIVVLLSLFFIIPHATDCEDCFINFNKMLLFGFSITVFSLIWIIAYLSISISISLKNQKSH